MSENQDQSAQEVQPQVRVSIWLNPIMEFVLASQVRKTPLLKAPEIEIPQPEVPQPEVPQPEFQVPNEDGIQPQTHEAPEVPVDAEIAADFSAKVSLGSFSRLILYYITKCVSGSRLDRNHASKLIDKEVQMHGEITFDDMLKKNNIRSRLILSIHFFRQNFERLVIGKNEKYHRNLRIRLHYKNRFR